MEKRKATRKGGPIVRMLQGNRMKLLEKISGSPTWTRTRDLRINSPSLYRLSYQGMKMCGHDTVSAEPTVREWTHRTFPRKRPTFVGNVSKVRMIEILPCPVNLEFSLL